MNTPAPTLSGICSVWGTCACHSGTIIGDGADGSPIPWMNTPEGSVKLATIVLSSTASRLISLSLKYDLPKVAFALQRLMDWTTSGAVTGDKS